MAFFNFSRVISSIKYGGLFNRLIANKAIDPDEMERIKRIKKYWDFYEGYHWEDIMKDEESEVTINYCRAFVNKFVAFELGSAFTINLTKTMAGLVVTPDGRTMQQFLDDVWLDNDRDSFCIKFGQSKSVTGDGWIRVTYQSPDDLEDPFGEYPDGKICVTVVPTINLSAEYDQHNMDVLAKVTVQYLIEKEISGAVLKDRVEEVLYKEVWTKNDITYYEDDKEIDRIENPYKVIPFVQVVNFPVSGRTYGVSDIDDIIPLNVELNMKKSDVSEIIDYHSAPITVVYGAKIGNLEKGANKVWGGIPKDGHVENLQLHGDLAAATTYLTKLKTEMCEVASIPEQVLGGTQAISNTSGVTMQYMNLPLIEKTKVKKAQTRIGLQRVNKLIIHIALTEGLIFKPETTEVEERDKDDNVLIKTVVITNGEYYYSEVQLTDTLPKDLLMEMQLIQLEMRNGLESREGALKRLGRDDITSRLSLIDEDRAKHPEYYGLPLNEPQVNSGMGNGETPPELVRQVVGE